MANYWKLILAKILIFGALPASVGTACMLAGWGWHAESAEFIENLRQVEGRVLDLRLVAGGLEVRARYPDEEGVEHTGGFKVAESEMAALQAAGVIGLVYDRRNPGRAAVGNIVTASNERLAALGLFGVGFLGLGAGVGYMGRQAMRIARVGKLLAKGQVVETEVREQSWKPGKRDGRFSYAYRGPDGRWYEGASPELPERELAKWPKGRTLRVVYDLERPRESEPDLFHLLKRMGRQEGEAVGRDGAAT